MSVPLQLETAGGDLTLDVIGDLLCGDPSLSVSLFSAARGEKDGYFYERCPAGKGPRGNVKLERSGGLDYLVGGEGQRVFPALLTPGSVDGGYCRVDNVDIEHLRGGHLEFDPRCTTCTSMTMRGRQHRRQDERETAGAGGEVCAELTGTLPVAYNRSEYLLVALRQRNTFRFCQSVDEQTQRDDQGCDGRHASVVAWCLVIPQGESEGRSRRLAERTQSFTPGPAPMI